VRIVPGRAAASAAQCIERSVLVKVIVVDERAGLLQRFGAQRGLTGHKEWRPVLLLLAEEPRALLQLLVRMLVDPRTLR